MELHASALKGFSQKDYTNHVKIIGLIYSIEKKHLPGALQLKLHTLAVD